MELHLPDLAVPDRVSLNTHLPAGERLTCADRNGPVRVAISAYDLLLKPSNTRGSNHGGWAFAFSATAPCGSPPHPQAI